MTNEYFATPFRKPDPPRQPNPDDYGPQARGGFYRVTRPTTFLAGEAGTEDVLFSGGGRGFTGMGGATIHVTVNVEGNVATERDLALAISDHLAAQYAQVGGLIPLATHH